MWYLLAAAVLLAIPVALKRLTLTDAAAVREEHAAQAQLAHLRQQYWRASILPDVATEIRRAS